MNSYKKNGMKIYLPIIGIVSNNEYVTRDIYKKTIHDVNNDYLNMIYKYGGVPIIIPNTNSFTSLKSFIDKIDALLLIGGEDDSDRCYSGKRSENPRDNFEIEIYNYFKQNKKPVLGICRGLQIINVAQGGTLKNIEENKIEHKIGIDGWVNYHDIKIIDNTKLKKLISKTNYTISSVHHQAIDRLGKFLVVSATASDGVVEAIESSDDTFIIAFQGHIEKCLNNYEAYGRVIKRFIEEAKNE